MCRIHSYADGTFLLTDPEKPDAEYRLPPGPWRTPRMRVPTICQNHETIYNITNYTLFVFLLFVLITHAIAGHGSRSNKYCRDYRRARRTYINYRECGICKYPGQV